jgi:hypothetical protein
MILIRFVHIHLRWWDSCLFAASDLALLMQRLRRLRKRRSLSWRVILDSLNLLPLAICISFVEFGFEISHSPTVGTDEVRPMWAIYDNSYAFVVPCMGTRRNEE